MSAVRDGIAVAVPDPVLRGQALAALDKKRLNVEATAVFATLLKPDTPPIATEAVGGALYSLLYDHVNKKGPRPCPTWCQRWSTSPWRRSSMAMRRMRCRLAEPSR